MQYSKTLHRNLKDKAELVSTIVCGDALVCHKKRQGESCLTLLEDY
jgi:hypothetical protein